MNINNSPTLPLKIAVVSLAYLAALGAARASLTASYQFNGQGNWSLDAVGSNNTPVGNLRAFVPLGSHVEKAFLYSSLTPSGGFASVTFDGTLLSNPANFTALGSNPYGLSAFRADVTSQVQAKVGSGSASMFTFTVNDENPNFGVDGEALAIVYSNSSEVERTIAFLDGFSTAAGDNFHVNLASPLIDPATPGFEALMSLGIGFSYQANGSQQYSNVDINGRRLTSSAGGEDKGQPADGGLITIGGIGDNPANPVDPFAPPTNARSDDELYNLALGNSVNPAPFLHSGDTTITVNTQNPSGDDNIFFAGINITAKAGVNQPPPDSAVPEPSTYGLLGSIGLLAAVLRKKLKK